ncbi:hypothetical protein BSKO_13352 [Bryopsis sp. KO-2023]|nr:hypothetical protein BSKO_13352 [Bryopsis sp. KO-2023]
MIHAAFQRAYSDPNRERWQCSADGLTKTASEYIASCTAAPTGVRGRPDSGHSRSMSSNSVRAMIKSALRNPLHYRKLQELPFPSPFEVNSAQQLHWFEDQTDLMDFSVSRKAAHSLEEASPPSRPSKTLSKIKSALSKPRRSLSKIASGVKKAKHQISTASGKLGDVQRTLKRSLSQGFGSENRVVVEEEEYGVWMVSNPVFGFDESGVGWEKEGDQTSDQGRNESGGRDGFDELARRFEPETPCSEGWQWSAAERGFGKVNCSCPCGEDERVDGFDALARRFQRNYSCPEAFRFPRVSFWGPEGRGGSHLIGMTNCISVDWWGDGQGEEQWRCPLWPDGGESVVENLPRT